MKNKNPQISIVIPVYNGEKFLDENISSVLNQTFKDFELIIINDKSTDKTLEIIQKYAKKDERIIVLNNKKNRGAQYTRNRGLKRSKGKYMAAFDADDVCLPKRFEIQFNYLEKHPEIFMVGGSAIIIDEKGNRLGVFLKYENDRKIEKKLPKVNCILHPTVMHRNTKEFFYRERFPISEDYDLLLNILSAKKKIVNIPTFLIKYRINQSSNTFTKNDPGYFYQKAKELYYQRIKTGKEDYENLMPLKEKVPVNPKNLV